MRIIVDFSGSHFSFIRDVLLSPSVISASIAVVGVVITAMIGVRNIKKSAEYQYASKMLDFRIRQLTEFYSPLMYNLEKSRSQHDELILALSFTDKTIPGLTHKDIEAVERYRLINNAYDLSNDEALADSIGKLIKSIIETGEAISRIITDKAGLIDSKNYEIYCEYLAHFQLLKAVTESEQLQLLSRKWGADGVYPRQLNRIVFEGYKNVFDQVQELKKLGDSITLRRHVRDEKIRKARKQTNMLATLAYYESVADDYASKHDGFDMSLIYSCFEEEINSAFPQVENSRIKILDAGCGCGRDTRHFIKDAHYSVTAIDISPSLLRKCRGKIISLRNSEDPEIKKASDNSNWSELSFDDICYRNSYHAVWAAASLLHLHENDIKEALLSLSNSLLPGGVMYLSFKFGRGYSFGNSVQYARLSRHKLSQIIKANRDLCVKTIWLTDNDTIPITGFKKMCIYTKVLMGRDANAWINAIVKRN